MKETVEEAKQRAANYMSLKGALEPKDVVLGYKTSLEAQMLDKIGLEEPKQERMYSEEEVIRLLQMYRCDLSAGVTPNIGDTTPTWFEQFKKK